MPSPPFQRCPLLQWFPWRSRLSWQPSPIKQPPPVSSWPAASLGWFPDMGCLPVSSGVSQVLLPLALARKKGRVPRGPSGPHAALGRPLGAEPRRAPLALTAQGVLHGVTSQTHPWEDSFGVRVMFPTWP